MPDFGCCVSQQLTCMGGRTLCRLRYGLRSSRSEGRAASLDDSAPLLGLPPMTVNRNEVMDKVVALTKRRGFIFPSSEIYGGLSGFYEFGPYGVALKRAIRDL